MQRTKSHYIIGLTSPEKKSTISQYFPITSCVVCGSQTTEKICQYCSSNDQLQHTTIVLTEKLKTWEENYYNCVKVSRKLIKIPFFILLTTTITIILLNFKKSEGT